MPPPRLTRPPWPCHLPWSTRQVRWTFDGPRRKLSTRRDDHTQTAHQSNDAQSGAQEADSLSPQEKPSSPPNRSEPVAHQERKSWWKSLFGAAAHDSSVAQPDTSHEPKIIIAERQKSSPPSPSSQQLPTQDKQSTQPQPAIPPFGPLIEHSMHFVSLKSKEDNTEDKGGLAKVSQTLQIGTETGHPEQNQTVKEPETLQDSAKIFRDYSQKVPDLPIDTSTAKRTATGARFRVVKDGSSPAPIERHRTTSPESTLDSENSRNTNLELRKEIEYLREELRQLRELYESKPTIAPQPVLPSVHHPQNPQSQLEKQTKPPFPVSALKGKLSSTLIKSQVEEPHGNGKMSPTGSGHLRMSQDSPELKSLKKARKRLKHTASTLAYAYSNVNRTSPHLQPLADLVTKTLGIFEKDFIHFFPDESATKFVQNSRARRRRHEEVSSDNLSGSTSTSPLPPYTGIQSDYADEGHAKATQLVGGLSPKAAPERIVPASLDNTIIDIQSPIGMTIGSQILDDAVMRNEAQLNVIQAFESPSADTQRLIRSLHTQAGHQKTPDLEDSPPQPVDSSISKENTPSSLSEQSLLEELFPEANSYIQPHYTTRNPYPRLDLPKEPLVRPTLSGSAKSQRQRIIDAFQARGEQLTVLQLTNCSTELTDADFRRLIPKGKHIETWARNGEFHKIVPGRDPLSLERLPFYYLIFKTPESALAYQNNVARLHKLSSLHQPSSIFSAIPPPKGFLEDGEDLNAVMSSYLLKPTTLRLNLNMVMQPYNPSLRALIEQGGYKPIVPNTDENGRKIWKVLLHIEGWEPLREDLYHVFTRHAYDRGLSWPFRNDILGISKLRDLVDIKQKFQAVSALSSGSSTHEPLDNSLEDLSYSLLNVDPLEQSGDWKGTISQVVMNRLYNRWIIEFDEEDAARRFARMWHRRILPTPKLPSWRDTEEPRMISAEVLW